MSDDTAQKADQVTQGAEAPVSAAETELKAALAVYGSLTLDIEQFTAELARVKARIMQLTHQHPQGGGK